MVRLVMSPFIALRSAALKALETILMQAVMLAAMVEAETEPDKGRLFGQIHLGRNRGARRPDPKRAADLQRQADEAKSLGNLEGATRLYSQALIYTPYNAALFFLRGNALLEANRPRDAAKDFVAGLQLDPGNQTLTFLMHTANAKAAEQSAARHMK